MEANAAVEVDLPSYRERQEGKTAVRTITDPQRHARCLELLATAAGKEHITSRHQELLAERIRALPARSDLASMLQRLAYVAGSFQPSLKIRGASDAISAEARRAGIEKDPEAYAHVRKLHAELGRELVTGSGSLIEGLLAWAFTRQGAAALHKAAVELELPEDAATYARLDQQLDRRSEDYQAHQQGLEDSRVLLARKGSLLQELSLTTIRGAMRNPPPIGDEDLEPLRRVEYTVLDRVTLITTWKLLGVILASVALYRFRHGRTTAQLAVPVRRLLEGRDWAWILAGSCLLPFIGNLVIAHLSPLAAHHWGTRWAMFATPLGQLTGTLLFALVSAVVLTRWRLGKRAGFLGFGVRHPWIGGVAAVAAALAVPLFGLAPHLPAVHLIYQVAFVLLALSALWLVVVAARALFGKRQLALERQAVARCLIPPLALAMILAIVPLPVLRQSELRWIARDRLMQLSPDEPAMSRYEFRAHQQLKAELLEHFEDFHR